MGILYSKLPDSIKKQIVDPYISIKDNEARISLRIKDSNDNLRRNDLINKIQYDLENKLNFKKDEFKITSQKCLNLSDEEFSKVSKEWSEGILKVFNSFPRFDWEKSQ